MGLGSPMSQCYDLLMPAIGHVQRSRERKRALGGKLISGPAPAVPWRPELSTRRATRRPYRRRPEGQLLIGVGRPLISMVALIFAIAVIVAGHDRRLERIPSQDRA